MVPNDEYSMGRIEATLDAIESSQKQMHREFKSFCKEDRDDHRRMLSQMATTSSSVATLCGKVNAHIGEDNRRFTLVWRSLFGLAAFITSCLGIATWLAK